MIRYQIAPRELTRRIRAHAPNWFTKVNGVVGKLPANPTSRDFVGLWSDIKEVYIALQGSKCVYCETLIEGNISNDVEHYRPKAKVSPWKVPGWLANAGLAVTSPGTPKGDPGYTRLAYEPLNYAASCKFCNSVLKKNLFPITGARQLAATDPRRMKGERPLLIYPIGNFDKDPESLIRFVGMHPEPAVARGHRGYYRAVVSIELFRLDDAVKRKALFTSRALLIGLLHGYLATRRTSPPGPSRDRADRWIRILLDSTSPHTNCLRCFERLYVSNPAEAEQKVDEAGSFLEGKSPPIAAP
jgi:hypothetical protein